ncbi:MAG: T9SS type A sorting domain-containing protein [Paludibacteraceae bacterium]
MLETNGVAKHSLPLSQITALAKDKVSNQELAVFPNPFYSDINFAGLLTDEVLLVFNAQNKLSIETKVNAGNVNLERLKSGIYFLRIGGKTAKVIKQ